MMVKSINSSPNIWLRRFSKVNVFFTLCLIFMGALVKSHEVGLSVPDWPTTYGKNMFAFPLSDMVGGIFYEHGHRLVATVVGFFTMVQAMWLGISGAPDWLKKCGYISLLLVLVQGLFGGITVLFFLPKFVSIIHGILAQTFFMIMILIAYGLSIERSDRSYGGVSRNIRQGALLIVGLVYLQLVLGAIVRHTASGMAIPDFPTMGGMWAPIFSEIMINNVNDMLFEMDLDMVNRGQVILHFIHRLVATVITCVVVYMFYSYRSIVNDNHIINRNLLWIVGIVLAQFTLGVATVLSERLPYVASLHVVTGAALLGACTLFLLRCYPVKGSD